MSYTTTDWKTGDYITVSKLNKIERGIEAAASAIQIIGFSTFSENTKVLDHTFEWIYDAVNSGALIMVQHQGWISYVASIYFSEYDDSLYGGVNINGGYYGEFYVTQWNGYPSTASVDTK